MVDLRSALNRQAAQFNSKFTYHSFKYEGANRAVMELADANDVQVLLSLNGMPFGNSQLGIRVVQGRGGGGGGGGGGGNGGNEIDGALAEQLMNYMGSRYDADSHFLDLGSIKQHAPSFDFVNFHHVPFANTVVRLIGQYCPDVVTISLSDNGIRTVNKLAGLADVAGKLQNLSLENNKIANVRDLEPLKRLQLRELILRGNPAANVSGDQYRLAVTTMFPGLGYLDQTEVKPVISFGVNAAKQLPPVAGSHFAPGVDQVLVGQFVQAFFTAMDGDRSSLSAAYAESAQLSVTVEPEAGRLLSGLYKMDRNHLRISSPAKRNGALVSGRAAICNALASMSQTRTNVDSLTVDSFLAGHPELLSVIVHGQMIDAQAPNTVLAFHRTFLLAPGSGGWPVTIVNDLVHVRVANGDAVAPATGGAPGTPGSPAQTGGLVGSGSPVASPQQLSDAQTASLVNNLVAMTNLSPAAARECLAANEWDSQRAVAHFQQLRAQNRI